MATKYSKRHYEHIAAIFSRAKAKPVAPHPKEPAKESFRIGQEVERRSLLDDIATEFKRDNPNFDLSRFLDAASDPEYWKRKL